MLLTKIRYLDPEVEGYGPGMKPEPESWMVSVYNLKENLDLQEVVSRKVFSFEGALSLLKGGAETQP